MSPPKQALRPLQLHIMKGLSSVFFIFLIFFVFFIDTPYFSRLLKHKNCILDILFRIFLNKKSIFLNQGKLNG